jgi:Spc7 kinetochore protein
MFERLLSNVLAVMMSSACIGDFFKQSITPTTSSLQDDYHPGAMSPAFPSKISEEEPSTSQQPPASPPDMDITQTLEAVQEEEPAVLPQQEAAADAAWNAMLASEPGDITAAVPSLGALAEADELEDLIHNNDHISMQQHQFADYDNVTAAVPRLGALLEEDEEEEILVGRAAAEAGVDTEMTVAIGNVLKRNEDSISPLPTNNNNKYNNNENDNTTGDLLRSTPTSTTTSDIRVEGQANKWGFVPGDDDTMELDLEEHGRMFMGDRTYAGMYKDDGTTGGTTANLLGGDGRIGAGDTPDSVTIHSNANRNNGRRPSFSPAANAENDAPLPAPIAGDGDGAPNPVNWTMPAFLPPYLAAGGDIGAVSDHPALHQSPALTNSSLNTMSTRRISVDARRASVTSRRASMFTGGQGDTGALLAASFGGGAQAPAAAAPMGSPTDKLSDVTEDLLADEDEGEEVGNVGGGGGINGAPAGDLLAGLQQQVRMLSNASPAASGFSPAFAAGGAIYNNKANATTKTPFSVGYADSSYNPATAGLLRTGGTTGLLNDTTGEAGGGDGGGAPVTSTGDINELTRGTHGTTRLLRMDATASSAIAAGAKALLNNNNNDDDITAPLVSPTMHGHHKMSHSPPASALSGGAMARHQYYQQQQYSHGGGSLLHTGVGNGTPNAGMHSVRSNRSASMLGRTPTGSVMRGPRGSMIIPSAGPGTHGPYAAPPGSAIAARYPGSAVAQGRLSQGFTPSLAPAITFQDFAKIVEVQFLDNLRRGSSINYADLAPNPVPNTLTESYTLLCITSPNLAELETAVHTLRSEASRLRASASELEMMLGGTNPPIFRHVQTASLEQLEAFRSNVGLLKRVCRAKAVVLLKDVRCQMEDSKAGRLARAADGLRTDLTYVNEQANHTRGVVAAAEKYAQETRERLAIDAEARVLESERRKRVAAARAALEEARSANAERFKRLEEATARVAELQREREALAIEHSQLQFAAENARAALLRLTALAVAAGKDPRTILSQIRAVEKLGACLGVKIEHTSFKNGSMVVSLRVGPIFKLELTSTPTGIQGTVHVVSDSSSLNSSTAASSGKSFNTMRGQPTEAQRSLAAAVAGFGPSGGEAFFVAAPAAPAAVQSTLARLQRCSDLVGELCYVRDLYRNICEVSAAPGGAAGLRLVFVGRHADVRFAVTLTPGPAYPLGALPCATKIYFDGDGQVTADDVAAAVARAPAGPGRIRAVCGELSDMVVKLAPKAAGQTGAFICAFGNPLFGSTMGAVQPVA